MSGRCAGHSLGPRRGGSVWLHAKRICAPGFASRHRVARGISLVEAMVSIIIVSTMLVAALNCVGTARSNESRLIERERALALATALLTEILQQAYADPQYGPASFGLASGENTGNRSQFDDVDDYDGWDVSPPQNKDGSVIPGCTGYEQVVSVQWVNDTDYVTAAAANTGVKQIQVTIKHNGKPVVTLTAYRTQIWINPAGWASGMWP